MKPPLALLALMLALASSAIAQTVTFTTEHQRNQPIPLAVHPPETQQQEFHAHQNPQFIQSKACPRDPLTGTMPPCTLDNPIAPGALVIKGYEALYVDTTGDIQGNLWQAAPNAGGARISYALNAKGGMETVYCPACFYEIVAEYVPALAFVASNHGGYNGQDIEGNQGDSDDVGWTLPVYLEDSNDLMIAFGGSGAPLSSELHGPYFPLPAPYFTIRDSEYSGVGLEDLITTVPGIYIATMNWNTAAHWALSVAVFKMGSTLVIQNPSFESGAPPLGNIQYAVPGWSAPPNGTAGTWTPSTNRALSYLYAYEFSALPDGKTVAYSMGGTISQDLGAPALPNKVYTLTVYVGHRADGFPQGNYTIALAAGGSPICSKSGDSNAIPAGTFQAQTVICAIGVPPSGNLSIVLSASGNGFYSVEFDDVTLQ